MKGRKFNSSSRGTEEPIYKFRIFVSRKITFAYSDVLDGYHVHQISDTSCICLTLRPTAMEGNSTADCNGKKLPSCNFTSSLTHSCWIHRTFICLNFSDWKYSWLYIFSGLLSTNICFICFKVEFSVSSSSVTESTFFLLI